MGYDHNHHQYHRQSHDCQHTHNYHKTHTYQLLERYQQYLHVYHSGSAIIIPHLHIVDIVQVADMYESYGTDVNDEYVDTHDYDDDTDDDNDHKKDSYTAAGAAPTQTRPGHAGPSQTPKILYVWLVLA